MGDFRLACDFPAPNPPNPFPCWSALLNYALSVPKPRRKPRPQTVARGFFVPLASLAQGLRAQETADSKLRHIYSLISQVYALVDKGR